MKIEAGKSYRTRGSERADIYSDDGTEVLPISGIIDGHRCSWYSSGRNNILSDSPYDLIAEWEDEPAPAKEAPRVDALPNGLSKREYIAARALPSVISAVYSKQTKENWVEAEVAVQAVAFADALLRALAEDADNG